MMGDFGMSGGWFGMGLGWIVLIVAGVLLVGYLSRRGGAGPAAMGSESARDVLDRRYASGEIGKDEYEQKKRDLQA